MKQLIIIICILPVAGYSQGIESSFFTFDTLFNKTVSLSHILKSTSSYTKSQEKVFSGILVNWQKNIQKLDSTIVYETIDNQNLCSYLEYSKTAKNYLKNIGKKNDVVLNYTKLQEVKSLMDQLKLAYMLDIQISGVMMELNEVTDTLDDKIKRLDSSMTGRIDSAIKYDTIKSNNIRESIENRIAESEEAIISATFYDPWFVGPSLYVESTFGFNALYENDTTKRMLMLPNQSYSLELLYYSESDVKQMGISFNTGISLLKWKNLIAQIGVIYLPNKLKEDIEGVTESGFSGKVSLLFQNRAWMTGLSWSPITGGGFMLLIGI